MSLIYKTNTGGAGKCPFPKRLYDLRNRGFATRVTRPGFFRFGWTYLVKPMARQHISSVMALETYSTVIVMPEYDGYPHARVRLYKDGEIFAKEAILSIQETVDANITVESATATIRLIEENGLGKTGGISEIEKFRYSGETKRAKRILDFFSSSDHPQLDAERSIQELRARIEWMEKNPHLIGVANRKTLDGKRSKRRRRRLAG